MWKSPTKIKLFFNTQKWHFQNSNFRKKPIDDFRGFISFSIADLHDWSLLCLIFLMSIFNFSIYSPFKNIVTPFSNLFNPFLYGSKHFNYFCLLSLSNKFLAFDPSNTDNHVLKVLPLQEYGNTFLRFL